MLESPEIFLCHAGAGEFWKSVKTQVKNMKCMADTKEN